MKYVLVIDVPEPMESNEVKVDYLCYYHCGSIIENKIDVSPKPLPSKNFWDIADYARGFNDCLKEITGEE